MLVFLTLLRSKNCIRLAPSHLQIHWQILGKIVHVGIPAALQMAVTSFSNVFVQSYINYFGPDCMSGWTAYAKIDQLVLLPMQSLALASTTFVGQNLGAGQEQRAAKGVRIAVFLSMGITLVLLLPVMLFAPYLVTFFNDKKEVVEYGTLFLHSLSVFYLLCCINQIYAGALRGSGNSRAPMIIMLLSFVVFRQIYLYVVSTYIANEVIPIAMSYPAGWLLASILTLIYYHRVKFTKSTLIEETE